MGFVMGAETDYGNGLATHATYDDEEAAERLLSSARDLAKLIRAGNAPVWDSVTLKISWVD